MISKCECWELEFEVTEITQVQMATSKKMLQFEIVARCQLCGDKTTVSEIRMETYNAWQIKGIREKLVDWYK